MNRRLHALALVVGLLCTSVLLSAHHSWPINRSKLVTVKGTVTAFSWMNPHPMISLDVRGENGQIEKWSVGGPAIIRMSSSGWTSSTVKPGDVMTGIGYQLADGSKVLRLEKVVLANGKELSVYGN